MNTNRQQIEERSKKKKKNAPVGFSPRPVETAPLFLRSMFQLSVSPAAFLRVKAKTALPCLMASLRSASLALRASLISSKATDEGNLSGGGRWVLVHLSHGCVCDRGLVPLSVWDWRGASDSVAARGSVGETNRS